MKRLSALMDLSGRVAVITGGAGHIGIAAGEAMAELGAAVAVFDRDPERTRSVADDLADRFGVATLPHVLDITDEDAVRAAAVAVHDWQGRADVLINTAALVGQTPLQGWVAPFDQQSPATWRLALETNLTAPFLLVQAFEPALRASGNGSVINVSSIYGMIGPDMRLYEGTAMGNPAAYGASKGGLMQFSRWLSTVLAPAVRVNVLSPGGVLRGQPTVFQARYAERTPLGRMLREEDLKGAFAYLASDLSACVTGQNLVVDGGWTAW